MRFVLNAIVLHNKRGWELEKHSMGHSNDIVLNNLHCHISRTNTSLAGATVALLRYVPLTGQSVSLFVHNPKGRFFQISALDGSRSKPWWHHQMETFSALLAICAGNSPVPGEFPAQRPVTRSFDVFFDLRLNKRLSKQSWGWWFETISRPLWRHCNAKITFRPGIRKLSSKIRTYFDAIRIKAVVPYNLLACQNHHHFGDTFGRHKKPVVIA